VRFRRLRIPPLGIAGRIAVTIVLALLLTQAVSAGLYVLDRSLGGPPTRPFQLVRRAVAVVEVVDAAPARDRARVVGALGAAGIEIAWHERAPEGLHDAGGLPFDALRRHLRTALGDPDRPVLIDVRGGGGHDRVMTLAVALEDGSWLSFRTDADRDGPFRLLRFVLWMALIAAVVVLVSWWAARRITAPIEGFARAAERLGLDGEAQLLPETGPRELRSATRAFNRMQDRLKRFVDDRTQMLAAIGHDLRTPLTRLRLRAEFVEDPDQQRRMLADLDEMEAMIGSTLAFARDDARQEARERIDLAALLESVADDMADAGRVVSYDGPAHRVFECRPVAVRRAVANLADNAAKYGGAARLSLVEGPDQVTVLVEDDGPGIPEAELERVFTPFYRLERSRSRDTGGTGLGLSVARTVARAHGGDVVLENRPGGGLRACLVLPEAGRPAGRDRSGRSDR
jgi:signal transduction histidine kinase